MAAFLYKQEKFIKAQNPPVFLEILFDWHTRPVYTEKALKNQNILQEKENFMTLICWENK